MLEQETAPVAPKIDFRTALKSPRSKRIGVWVLSGFLVFGLLGFFAAPALIKSILLSQLSKELHRQVSIEKIDVNPYALSASLKGLSIKAESGKELAGFDELYVNLSSASIFKRAIVVDDVRLQGLRLSVAREAENRYDISDLLDEWMKPSETPTETPGFSVNNIQLMGGKLVFDDQPKAQVHTIDAINLSLPFISNLPYQAKVFVEPSFSANINGSPFVLKGRSKPFDGNHESELDLDLDRFDLAEIQPYLPDNLPIRLGAGLLDTEMKVVFKAESDQVFSLGVTGSTHVSGMVLIERNGSPLLAWKRLDIDIEHADLINQKFDIKRVVLDGLDSTLTVNRQGEFNVLTLADNLAKQGEKSVEPKVAPAKPLVWSLGQFEITNGLIRWRDDSKLTPIAGEVRHLHALIGKVDSRLTDPIEIAEASYQVDLGERLQVNKMSVKELKIDLPAHRIDIAEVTNSQTKARMLRNKTGKIEWVSSPLLKTIRNVDAKVQDDRPWVGYVGKLNVEDLSFRFEDQATRPAAIQSVEGLNLHAEGLTNESGKKGKIALKTKVNQKGSLTVDGSVQVFPLDIALNVETSAIPLLSLQPYFAEYVTIALTRGQVSSKGEATAQIDKDGLKAGYKGSLTVGDLLTVDRDNSADFLKWKSLFIGGIDFRLAPLAINVGEIALTDYYSKLILNPSGRLNVLDVVKKPAAETAEVTPPPVEPVAKVAEPGKAVLPIKIGKITLQNGTVNFSDYFVKPNYSVNLTRLGGRVTGLSSAPDTVADLDLRGRYANSAPVQILAKLNPLSAKTFLDMKAEISGVDLVGFSPYSGKYAGYDIEKGKLSLTVAYKLENNQLTADNRLFIDQFTFGNKVDSPDATSLPVNLAISLLKNNRGEIDINLPISGSLDDPDFSVGGLIFKVIGNLFVKAITSPFALLGSMFGGGEELSNVEFAPGRTNINDAGVKKLTALAKALVERESLKLEITGRADPEADKEGIKRVAVERAVKSEKSKDALKKGTEGESLEGIVLAPDEYKTYLTRAYKDAKFPKPRNMVGLQKDLPVDEMEKLMWANARATEEDMLQLAKQRAENVQAWLLEQGKVPAERVFLVPPKVETDEKAAAARADFSLR
jgi:uncharacterized protein involved in outer membrane biogenesis